MKIEPFKMEVTPDQSRQVQEIVFKNGGAWRSGRTKVNHTQLKVLAFNVMGDKDGLSTWPDTRSGSRSFADAKVPLITFADFMARYGGAPQPAQLDTMRKIVTIAEEAHKNGDIERCSMLLNSLADYISNNALNKGIKPTSYEN